MPDGWHDQAGSGGAGTRIVAALQRVLNLQLQLRAEVLEVDGGGADELAVGDEAVGIGTAMPLPPVVMARAEDLRWVHDPEVAERQPALGCRGVARGQVRCVPGRQAGFADPVPPVSVPGTQPVSGTTCVSAAIHDAGSQWPAAPDRRTRGGQEVLHRRAAALAEPDGVCVAKPSPDRHRCPVAVLDSALVGDEDGVVGGRDVDVGAELRPDDGHQLLQQPRATRHLLDGDHSWTSRPVNQPAASSVFRASSTVR